MRINIVYDYIYVCIYIYNRKLRVGLKILFEQLQPDI